MGYNTLMKFLALVPAYALWHYTKAFADIFRIWTNFIRFTAHFFSIGTLFRTLFAPWQRMHESYGDISRPKTFASALLVNGIIRLVGAFLRLSLIGIGLAALLFVFIGGLAFFVLWIFMPAVVIGGFGAGIAQIGI